MKIIGKYMGGYNGKNLATGSYAAIDAAWVHVETYSGDSLENDQRCFLKVGADFLVAAIKRLDGDYMAPETANSLVREAVTRELLDLEKYDMGFFGVWDTLPDSISIRNDMDEDFNTIPLEVVGV